ncbi:MAG: NAD(P)H-binding protein [Bauldia sp.]|nr:NAD(P)H-binding protein [Bauldia sp.]
MILVTGATGHVGRAVVSLLSGRGEDVAAMVRNVAAAARRVPRDVPLRVADYEDVPAVTAALAGIDSLVFIASDGEAGAVMRHHTNVIEAARKQRVRHVTFTSIVDVDVGSSFYFAPVYQDAERRLAASGIPATVLRCGIYSDFILQYWLESGVDSGVLALPTGDGRVAPISRDDVAVAVTEPAVGRKPGSQYLVTGSQALGVAEIAASYSDATGTPLRYRPCSQDDYLMWTGKRLTAPWPRAFTTLCGSIAEGRYGRVSTDFASLTGRDPETFREFLLRSWRVGRPV